MQKITFWNNLMPTATTDHGPSLEAETKAQTANNCSAPTEPKSAAAAATATAKVIHYKDGVFSNLNAKPEVIRVDELSYEDKPPVSEKKCKLEDQQLTAIVFCFLFLFYVLCFYLFNFQPYHECVMDMPPSYHEALDDVDVLSTIVIGKQHAVVRRYLLTRGCVITQRT